MTKIIFALAGLAGCLVLAALPAIALESRTWTTQDGQRGAGEFVAITPGGMLVVKNAEGREVSVTLLNLSTNDLAYLSRENKLGPIREWKLRSGQSVRAHYVSLQPNGVAMVSVEGKGGVIPMDRLSEEDVAWLELEAPIPLEQRVAGNWRGYLQTGHATCHTAVTITKYGNEWRGSATLWAQVSTNRASMSKAAGTSQARRSFTAKSTFTVTMTNGVMTLSKFNTTSSHRGSEWPAQWALGSFSAKLSPPGVWIADEEGTGKDRTWFLAHEPLFRVHPPVTVQKGKVLAMTCTDSRLHYSLYVPNSYDPKVPAPLLVNDSPGKRAAPLSPKMAEELGWIMVGLTESGNTAKSNLEWVGNNAAVIFDVTRMFNIDPRRLYFSGLSGGARRSAYRAIEFQDHCAGVVCIGAGYYYYQDGVYAIPPKDIPIFFIGGESDMNRTEVSKTMMEPEKKCGRPCQVLIHPGGHTWGRPEDHEAALKWLDSQWYLKHPSSRKSNG
jgi:hypothetical protein